MGFHFKQRHIVLVIYHFNGTPVALVTFCLTFLHRRWKETAAPAKGPSRERERARASGSESKGGGEGGNVEREREIDIEWVRITEREREGERESVRGARDGRIERVR